jgi:plasmid stabilization system protein ParE
MVKRRIIWSHRARVKLYEILEFYVNRNRSKVYSAKLYRLFTKNIDLLVKHPELGIKTSTKGIRGLIVLEFIIYYEFTNEALIVHTIWPSKQNPDSLNFKM